MKRFAAGTVLGLFVGVMFTAFVAALEALKWLHDKEEDDVLLPDGETVRDAWLHVVPGVEPVREPIRTLP